MSFSTDTFTYHYCKSISFCSQSFFIINHTFFLNDNTFLTRDEIIVSLYKQTSFFSDLDYDLGLRSYQLTAVISDGVHIVTLTIQMKVTPVNEFPPQFGPSTSISVPENKNIGSLVYTAMATDNDAITSDLEPLTYSILTGF